MHNSTGENSKRPAGMLCQLPHNSYRWQCLSSKSFRVLKPATFQHFHSPCTPYFESMLSINIWPLLSMTQLFLFTLIKDIHNSFKLQISVRSPTLPQQTDKTDILDILVIFVPPILGERVICFGVSEYWKWVIDTYSFSGDAVGDFLSLTPPAPWLLDRQLIAYSCSP